MTVLYRLPRPIGVAENLDRDGAVEPRVARLPDLAHAASADGGQDFIWPEAGADGQCQKRSYGLGFQFKITVIGELASSETVATRNRWPSEETMYW